MAALPWRRLEDLSYPALRRLQLLATARLSAPPTTRATAAPAQAQHPPAAVSRESPNRIGPPWLPLG